MFNWVLIIVLANVISYQKASKQARDRLFYSEKNVSICKAIKNTVNW